MQGGADARHVVPRLPSKRGVTRGLSLADDTIAAHPGWAPEFLAGPHARWCRPEMVRLNACRRPRLRSLVAMVAAAGALVILGHSALMHSEPHAAHLPHPLVTSLGSEFAVNIGHPHLVDGWSTACHEVFTTPALPRSANGLIGLGAVAAVIALIGSLVQLVVPAGRGPPSAPAAILAGQDLLTRFCLARR